MFKEREKPTTTVKTLQAKVPNVFITAEAAGKMQLYVDKCDKEIGWLGTAHKNEKENYYVIDDTYLFDQEVHATTTEITPAGLSSFGEAILSREDGMEIWNSLRVWGHSHVRMGVTPSGQDDTQMNTFKDCGHPWFIRIIANKHGELKVDIYDYQNALIMLDVPWSRLETDAEAALADEYKAISDEYELKLQQVEDALEGVKKAQVAALTPTIEEEMKVLVRQKVYTTTHYGGVGTTRYGQSGYNGHSVRGQQVEASLEKKTNGLVIVSGGKDVERDEARANKITDVSDIWLYFNLEDLIKLSVCSDTNDLESTLWENNRGHHGFTAQDLREIWAAAREIGRRVAEEEQDFGDTWEYGATHHYWRHGY